MPRRNPLLPLLLCVVLLACARPAPAWNGLGHMMSAELAYKSLTPAARAKVNALLQKHPFYQQWVQTMPLAYPDTARYVFMHAATWPDDIRKTNYDRPPWHYKDLPIVFPSPGFNPDPATLQSATPNAETQIVAETTLLASSSNSDADRAIALCWVEHLIGDVHQPLHGASEFTVLLPAGDKGGNAIYIAGSMYAPPGNGPLRPANLHAFWDGQFGDSSDPRVVDIVAATVPALPRTAFPQIKSHPNVADWLVESSALARQYAYLDGALPQTLNPPDPQHPGASVTATLPAGYVAQARKLSDRQIVLAAYRLADTINAALGTP